MADEQQATVVAPAPQPVPAPNLLEGGDDTLQMVLKMVIATKLAPYLVQWGVTLDPTLLSAAIFAGMHKLHIFLRDNLGWKWL